MKLSIFPAAKAHPINKDEKKSESFKVSSPHFPEAVEFNDDEELLQLVTNYAWSPFLFSGVRHADNFISTDLLVYDIDKGLTIENAELIVRGANLACLCLPSPSHSEGAHRFRIILPLSVTITGPEIYRATWLSGAELFGVVDEQCKDLARFYFGSTTDDGFWTEGSLFEPKAAKVIEASLGQRHKQLLLPLTEDIQEFVEALYGEKRTMVPEAVDFFVRNAHSGLPGEWTNALNRFCFSLALSNVEEDAILMVCKQLSPQELDSKDLYQIKRAIRDGKNAV